MGNVSSFIPLIIGALGLVGSAGSLVYTYFLQNRLESVKLELQQQQVHKNLAQKYSPPLAVAAYDLQHRLFELVELPISRSHIEYEAGRDDLKIYSCYLLAQYLAYSHILRIKTGYLAFSDEPRLKDIRGAMYMIDQELDQRRPAGKHDTVGVWPGDRVMISELMLKKGEAVNELLDGGYGVEVKGYHEFYEEWKKTFQKPMGFFCQWIDVMLVQRVNRSDMASEAPLRATQHLLLDLIFLLDEDQNYIPEKQRVQMQCRTSRHGCDCTSCENKLEPKTVNEKMLERQASRYCEMGIWNMNGQPIRDGNTCVRTIRWGPKGGHIYYDPSGQGLDDFTRNLEKVTSMTVYPTLD